MIITEDAGEITGKIKIARASKNILTRAILCVRLAAHVSFARHGRALAGESPEHAQVVGNV